MKTWYNSKIFVIFVNFSSMFFWVQNVSMPPDQKFSIPSQQSFVGLKDVVLKTSSAYQFFVFQDVLKTSWKHLARRLWKRKVVTLKTSSRRLEDKKNVYWGYLHLTNLNVYLTNLYFANLYRTNLRLIQNALVRAQ